MFSCEQELLGIGIDRFEDPQERLLDLMLQVELVVDGKVILKDIEGVFGFLIALGTFRCLDHHICDTITD